MNSPTSSKALSRLLDSMRLCRTTALVTRSTCRLSTPPSRPLTTTRPPKNAELFAGPTRFFPRTRSRSLEPDAEKFKQRPAWLVQKEVLKSKLDGAAWNPRKKLSPDTMEGIRHLHQTQPEKFTTAVLAEHFKVSPEAVRRILKSKWRPSDEEQDARLLRWDKRGEKIWTNLVELGVKPPKRWRDMGVGRSIGGEKPAWKSRRRNTVAVQDSFSRDAIGEDLAEDDVIPIVGESSGLKRRKTPVSPLSDRLGV